MKPIKNSHCSYCGSLFTEQEKWPRKCFVCYNDSYSNPLPVVVAIIPVFPRGASKQLGVLIIQRNIEPQKGGWALPGGYMDAGETWQMACSREVMEEVGLLTHPENYKLMDVTSAQNGNLLIFANYTRPFATEEIDFVENPEVLVFDVTYQAKELAFPTHTEILSKYLGMKS